MFTGVTAMCWSSLVWPIPVRPIPVKALEDAIEGILMKEPQISFFVARKTLMKSRQISVGNLKARLFTIQISLDFLKGGFSWQICDMGDFILNVKMT